MFFLFVLIAVLLFLAFVVIKIFQLIVLTLTERRQEIRSANRTFAIGWKELTPRRKKIYRSIFIAAAFAFLVSVVTFLTLGAR